MAQIADLIVKKADGTTNVTFNALAGSAGDKQPAVWVQNSQSTVASRRSKFTLTTMFNGPKTARRSSYTFTRPVYDANGVLLGNVLLEGTALVPLNLEDTEVSEGIAQGTNCVASALVQSAIKAGYAPN